jgi:NodT family efflux transporter outer membrane factor (OMF) lipoprotein
MVGRAVSKFIVSPTAAHGVRRLSRRGLALSLALLTACASGVKPLQPDMAMPPAYDVQAQSMLAPAVLDKWWMHYSDPQLTALIERAQRQGFTAREALARLNEAQAVRKGALSRFDPQGALQGNAEMQRITNLGNTNTGVVAGSALNAGGATSVTGTTRTAGLSLPVSWELDLFGRRAVAGRAADADLTAARFEHEAAHSALTAEVARTLFQARGLALQLEDAEANARIGQQVGDLLNRRVERGLAASSEADRVAADVAQANAQAANLSAELNAARRALLVLLGDGLAPLTSLAVVSDIGAAPVVPQALPSDLLARRPDVRQAEARIRAAAGNVRLAELEFFPRLTLQPGLGVSLQRGALDASTGFWSLGAGLALPILDRPRLSAALQATSARGQQVVIAYERSVQTAFSEADQALTRLDADRRRVATLTEGETRARRAYDAALKRFELGFADLQTALDAERVWRSTRSALTGARIDALLRSVQAFQALGGGWPSTQTPAVAHAPT